MEFIVSRYNKFGLGRILCGPEVNHFLPNFMQLEPVESFHRILILNCDRRGVGEELCLEVIESEILWISRQDSC